MNFFDKGIDFLKKLKGRRGLLVLNKNIMLTGN